MSSFCGDEFGDALYGVFRKQAGNVHAGCWHPDTWKAIADEARCQMTLPPFVRSLTSWNAFECQLLARRIVSEVRSPGTDDEKSVAIALMIRELTKAGGK
jgi:hypothetical protein